MRSVVRGTGPARAATDIGAIVHTFKANLRRRGIRGRERSVERFANGSDTQDATAAGYRDIALTASAGVEHLHTSKCARIG